MELEELRLEIDKVDEEIIRLLANRFELTKSVGMIKSETGVNSLSPERERAQFKQFQELSDELNLSYPMVEKVFQAIRDQVLENHEKIKEQYESK